MLRVTATANTTTTVSLCLIGQFFLSYSKLGQLPWKWTFVEILEQRFYKGLSFSVDISSIYQLYRYTFLKHCQNSIQHFNWLSFSFAIRMNARISEAYTYIYHVNGHFSGKPGIASYPNDSPSTFILTLSVLTEQTDRKNLHAFFLN